MKIKLTKRLFFTIACGIAGLVFSSSCKHTPQFNDMAQVSYVASIAPIINSNCTFSGCHGDLGTQKFKLLSYEGVISAGVEPGKPHNSKLYKSLVSLNSEEIMPKQPYNELTEKQIQLIYVWIGQGAKNN